MNADPRPSLQSRMCDLSMALNELSTLLFYDAAPGRRDTAGLGCLIGILAREADTILETLDEGRTPVATDPAGPRTPEGSNIRQLRPAG